MKNVNKRMCIILHHVCYGIGIVLAAVGGLFLMGMEAFNAAGDYLEDKANATDKHNVD